MPLNFRRPVKSHPTWIAECDGKPIAKIKRTAFGYLGRLYGGDLGGTHGDISIKRYDSLKDAKAAICAAACN